MYAPLPSVTSLRTKPVSVCVAVTVTPGRTALLSSVTRPLNCAVDNCASATVLVRRRPNKARHNSRNGRLMMPPINGGPPEGFRNPPECLEWSAGDGPYLGADASGPPAVKSSRPSLTFLIETSDPLDSTTFPANVVKVTFSPASRSFGPHPCRRTVFGLVI